MIALSICLSWSAWSLWFCIIPGCQQCTISMFWVHICIPCTIYNVYTLHTLHLRSTRVIFAEIKKNSYVFRLLLPLRANFVLKLNSVNIIESGKLKIIRTLSDLREISTEAWTIPISDVSILFNASEAKFISPRLYAVHTMQSCIVERYLFWILFFLFIFTFFYPIHRMCLSLLASR